MRLLRRAVSRLCAAASGVLACLPGYWFVFHVPPRWPSRSKNWMSVMPYHLFNVAPSPMAENPVPIQQNWL